MVKMQQKIPDGWTTKQIVDVAAINKGLTYKSSDYAKDENSGMTFFTLKSISKGGGFNNKGIKFYKGDYQDKHIVEPGDLIIANTDLTRNGDVVGAPVIVPKINGNKSVISMDISKIKVKKNVDKLFFYYLLSNTNIRKKMRNFSTGTTVLHLHLNSVKKINILLPHLPQQKKIAQILSTVDDEIVKTGQIITENQNLKKGFMQELFSKGIGHTKFKKTKLGMIPEEWEVKTTGKICKSIVPGRDKPKSFNGDIPWVTIPDISNGRIQYEKAKKTTRKELGIARNKIVPKNSVIMTCVGELGIVTITDREISLNQQLHAFLPGKLILPSYLMYYLVYKKRLIKNLATKTTVLYLNKLGCESISVFLPNVSEQKQIVLILSNVDDKIRINQKIKKQLFQLKKGLMQELLSGKKLVS